jgi:hypothetical protein
MMRICTGASIKSPREPQASCALRTIVTDPRVFQPRVADPGCPDVKSKNVNPAVRLGGFVLSNQDAQRAGSLDARRLSRALRASRRAHAAHLQSTHFRKTRLPKSTARRFMPAARCC